MNLEWSHIEKVLNGTASAEEVGQFHVWLAQNPSQKEYFERVHHYYDNTEEAVAENSLLRKSHHSADNIFSKQPKKRDFRLMAIVSSAAAVLALIFLVYNSYNVDEKIVAEQSILNVREGITIVKDSGEEFSIEEIHTENMKVDSSKKELIYVAQAEAEKIEYHTITIPKERDFTITLADGTRVYLNAGSQLRYPSRFVDGEPRKVYLSGEGFFDVTPSEKDKFIVNVENMNVVVYGTKFNINSYRRTIETVLVEGSVAIDINGTQKMMKPNEKAIVSKLGDKIEIENVNVQDYVSWTTGYFTFENKSMEEIAVVLERWYDCKIAFENDVARKEIFSCHVEKQSTLDDFLKALSSTNKIKFRRENNHYFVR